MTAHIKQDTDTTWCGASLDPGFHFANVEAAVYNGAHDKNPRACALCTRELITHLINGRELAPEHIE
jgi:hypothetical protein